MAAVVAVAVHYKPQLCTTAVVCIAYSWLRSMVDVQLAELLEQLCTSPGTCAVVLGLCVSWAAAHTYSSSSATVGHAGSSSSPNTPCQDKSAVAAGSAGVEQQKAHGKSTQADAAGQSVSTSSSSSSRPVRLAEPPFSADLSVPQLGGNSRQLFSSSCKPRRRRLPRLSIELTPLPRLSVDFSSYRQYSSSSSRASSIRRSLDRCSLMPDGSSDMCSGSWGILEDSSSCSRLVGGASLQLQQQLPTHAVGEVTDSLGLGELAPGVGFIEDVINETHLLQIGAMLGEQSARGALAAREAGGPVGHPTSFYGSADTLDHGEPWELLISEGNENVLYWGWRKPLRKGLYMYMTRSVFLGATPAELRAFMNDDAYRVVWDQSTTVLRPVVMPDPQPAAATGRSSSGSGVGSSSNAAVELMAAAAAARMSASGDAEGLDSGSTGQPVLRPMVLPHESVVMQALVQFPKPMASRSYLYARRVWPRPADGGCYCLSKGCTLPLSTAVPSLPGRSVPVDDYCSGCVIRAPSPQLLPLGTDTNVPAAEVFMVYFEDSHVRASLANLGIKKGLWPLVQRTEKALRVYQAGAAANLHLYTLASAEPASCSGDTDCCQPGSSVVEVASPRPAAVNITRSASLGSCEFGRSGRGALLSRSASLQEPEHKRRLSSASLPCFPLEPGLDDDEPLVQEPCSACNCSCGGSSEPAACSAGTSTDGFLGKPAQAQHEQQDQKKPKSGGSWGWLGRMGTTVCGVIKQSGQLLAAASVVLWRSGNSVTMLLPRFEWRVLSWAYQHISGTRQLLLGAPAGAAAAVNSGKLAHVSSHPLSEWARPGFVSKLTTHVVRRLPSHPITTEDLLAATEGPQAIPTVRSEPVMQLRLEYAAAMGSSHGASSTAGSAVSSTAGSDVASFSVSCSSCGCCCGSSAGGVSSSGSSRRCDRSHGGSSSGGSRLVRDETGGRRHQRVMVKLVQTAGLRVARRMARLAGITE